MAKARLENALRNSGASLINRLAQIFIKFIIRTLFIKILGNEYTGISTLFTDIMSVLSLAEMGLDSSMIFALYRPLAEQDGKHVASLMNFYRTAFNILGFVVLGVGVGFIPFLQYIVKDVPNIKEDIRFIFLIYVVSSASSYFFIYKSVLIRADQRSSVISNITTAVSVVECVAEVALILVFKQYMIYLILHFIATVISNLCLSHKAERMYPKYLNDRTARITPAERNSLFKNFYALVIYNLAAVVLNSADSIFISAFVGTAQIAVVGNFTLISNSVKNTIQLVVYATRPSIGNLVATSSVERQKIMFKRINFITFWVACFSASCLFALLNPFIGNVWFNETYKINLVIVASIVINFYISIMSCAIGTFRSTNGLFVQGWIRPAVMAAMNISLDYLMGKKWGVSGIYFATSISLISTQVWYDPYVVFKYVFKQKPWEYYLDYLWQVAFTVACCGFTYYIINYITLPNKYVSFIVSAFVAALIPNIAIVAAFFRTEHFQYTKSVIARFLR